MSEKDDPDVMGNGQGTKQRHGQGTNQGSDHGTSRGNRQGNDQGTNQESDHGTSQESDQGTSQGNRQGTNQGSDQGSIDAGTIRADIAGSSTGSHDPETTKKACAASELDSDTQTTSDHVTVVDHVTKAVGQTVSEEQKTMKWLPVAASFPHEGQASVDSVAKGEECGSKSGTVDSVASHKKGEEPAGSFGDLISNEATPTHDNLSNGQAGSEEITDKEVDGMNFYTAASWLEERDIEYDLEDLEDLRNLIKQKLKEKRPSHETIYQRDVKSAQVPLTDSQRMMREILAQDQKMKEELFSVYEEIVQFVQPDIIGEEVHDVLSETFQDYKTTIASYMSQLVNGECPIVVAGETSAGKSSLLNLILGSEVLPHSLLCATSTICRLHHSDTKCFKVNEDTTPTQIASDNDGAEELGRKLKEFILSAESRKEHKYKVIDIYWPIPMLKDLKRVTIVDTPGVGESEEMTQRVLNYLPNAVAFIYVINSANAAGIQNDRLLHIINEQKRWEREGKLSSFDYESTLFVCNQWDRVEKSNEGEKVWKQTLEKLRDVLPGMREERVFKMSTLEAAKYIKCGLGHTEKFQKLLEGIQWMVPESLKAKVRQHFRWLEKFLSSIQSVITGRITHARSTEEDKQKLLDSVLNRLNKLSMDSEKVKKELIDAAREECRHIVDKLHQYLDDGSVHARLCSWQEEDAPDIGGGDFEVTRFNADKIILTRVQEELKGWESNERLIRKLSDKLTSMFYRKCNLLGQECTKVDLMIEGFTSDSDLHTVIGSVDFGGRLDKPLFTGSEKAILVVAAPLWIPLVTAASLLFLPVGIGMMIRENIKANKQRKNYSANKAKFMVEWTEKMIQTAFTRENLEKFIFSTYFDSFKVKIDELCRDFIPKQIEADRKQVINIHEDRRTSKEILSQFLPMQTRLKDVLGSFYLFGLQFMTEDLVDLRCLEKLRLLGKGNFSDVYLVNWKREDGVRQAALKILRRTLTGGAIYSQLTEVSCHRKLKHENIVQLYGISYSCSGDCDVDGTVAQHGDDHATDGLVREKTLMLLLEYCHESLEDKVFKNKRWQCGGFSSVQSRQEAFEFYIQMSTGICKGLAYIHTAGYLHRDLKLSNVLVKDNVAKICDMGFAKLESNVAGTFVGTISHMSPELSSGKSYNWATDIYSLGILLWELWYGRHAYSEPEFSQFSIPELLDLIRVEKGFRPKFSYKYQMVAELQQVVQQCWEFDPQKRPSAVEIGSLLTQLAAKYSADDSDDSGTQEAGLYHKHLNPKFL